jgi:hypothetical protein
MSCGQMVNEPWKGQEVCLIIRLSPKHRACFHARIIGVGPSLTLSDPVTPVSSSLRSLPGAGCAGSLHL